MMKSMALRAEEARRQAHAASLKIKQRQSEALKERAAIAAVEAQKVEKLRALRLAKEALDKDVAEKEAAEKLAAAPKKRRIVRPALVAQSSAEKPA